ncbi:glutamate-rich protein 1 [Geothlypis trichas]
MAAPGAGTDRRGGQREGDRSGAAGVSRRGRGAMAGSRRSDKDATVMSPRRVYTVDLPPEGYVAVTPDALSNAVSENSGSSADSTEEEYQGQSKRKRIRRKKQKSSSQISSNFHGEQTDLGMQETVVQDNLQLQQTDSPKISKNKKRKMKKKRQKEKKRAAGLVTKTTSMDFTYQPDKSNKEEAAGLKDIGEKADSILDFLQATQQIYFTDKKSQCRDAAVNSAAVQELLQCLELRTISSSDVTHLHRLKSLVLLQDTERLKDALKQFQEQSMMSPELQGLKFCEDSEIMVIPLRRMTPGYIRLLQTQAAAKIVINPSDTALQRAALLLGVFGISISSYSTHQLTQTKRFPSTT